MIKIVDSLLNISRMELMSFTSKPSEVDLQKSVGTAISQFEKQILEKALDIKVSLSENFPQIFADPGLVDMILANLLSNAIKYTRGRDSARIEIGCRKQDGEIICFVRDNGAGFDMRFADKLFGVFQRLHRVEEFEGTGIGLASVRRIIERHGGRTWAEGAVDGGATFFYFSLPTGEEICHAAQTYVVGRGRSQ